MSSLKGKYTRTKEIRLKNSQSLISSGKNKGENHPMWKGGKYILKKWNKLIEDHGNKGKKRTEEEKKKISLSMKGRKAWNKGKRSKDYYETELARNTKEYTQWRIAVFQRDKFTCQKSGKRGGVLNAHHIIPFSTNKSLRFDVNNGITLSEKEHIKFHKIYGKKDNTEEQLILFLSK